MHTMRVHSCTILITIVYSGENRTYRSLMWSDVCSKSTSSAWSIVEVTRKYSSRGKDDIILQSLSSSHLKFTSVVTLESNTSESLKVHDTGLINVAINHTTNNREIAEVRNSSTKSKSEWKQ